MVVIALLDVLTEILDSHLHGFNCVNDWDLRGHVLSWNILVHTGKVWNVVTTTGIGVLYEPC